MRTTLHRPHLESIITALPGAALLLGLAASSVSAAGQGNQPPHELPEVVEVKCFLNDVEKLR